MIQISKILFAYIKMNINQLTLISPLNGYTQNVSRNNLEKLQEIHMFHFWDVIVILNANSPKA